MQNSFNIDEKDHNEIINDSTNDLVKENDTASAVTKVNLTEHTTNQFDNSNHYSYQKSSDGDYHSKYNRLNQISGIKTAGIFSIVGIFLFILPGVIAAIIAIVKLATFNSSEETTGLKTAAIVFLVLTILTIAVAMAAFSQTFSFTSSQ